VRMVQREWIKSMGGQPMPATLQGD